MTLDDLPWSKGKGSALPLRLMHLFSSHLALICDSRSMTRIFRVILFSLRRRNPPYLYVTSGFFAEFLIIRLDRMLPLRLQTRKILLNSGMIYPLIERFVYAAPILALDTRVYLLFYDFLSLGMLVSILVSLCRDPFQPPPWSFSAASAASNLSTKCERAGT